MNLTWQQKLFALDKLAGPGKLIMREPGNWLCSHSIDICGCGGFLIGGCGNGPTPEEAVLSQWERLVVQLKPGQCLTPHNSQRKVRWNGFMWADIKE